MKKTDISVSLRDGVRKRLKQYSRLLSLSLSASLLLLLTLLWQNPAFSQGNCSLGCHGAQVSLGLNCTAEITTAMVADTSQCTNGDFTVYVITLTGDTIPTSPTVTGAYIGQTLIASVYDNISGNSCWSYITVQDKLPPVMDCQCTPVTNIQGAITLQDPSANLSFGCMAFPPAYLIPPAGVHHYDEWNFRIAVAGMYTFTFQGNIADALAAIYDSDFDPNNVCVNLIGGDDDSQPPLDPHLVIQLNMVPGNYILLTTTWTASAFGTYSWSISGPGEVFNAEDDCFRACTDIDIIHPAPDVVDNCTQNATPILINEQVEVLCHPEFVKKLTRWWTATDAAGNHADTCMQVFYLERIDFADVVWPDSFTVADNDAFKCDGLFADADHDGIPDAVPVEEGGAGVPTINGIPIFPDFMFYCNSSVWFQDVPIHNPNSCVHKVMRVWTLNEWHCQGERDTLYSQLIEVVDDQGPTIICPPGFNHTTTGHDCTATIWIPSATVSDNCSTINSVTVTYPGGFKSQNGLFYAELPVGNNIITYTAYDKCYNSSTCTMTIVVQDLTPPVAVCDQHTIVSLTLGGPHGLTKVPAEVFDDGSYDACGPVTFRAWRMPESCIDFDWTTEGAGVDEIPNGIVNSRDAGEVPRTKVPFACCDAGAGPIMVVLEVTDASGNTNTCMVEVQVQDKIKPRITCPSSVTISCDYPLNIDDLSAFGDVVFDQHDVQTWCVYDPTNPYANPDGFICGTDGLATDNCDVDVRVTNESFINNCGIGYIRRTWTAIDASGSDNCQQYIWVQNFHPIDSTSIDWPDDFHGLECALGTDPDDLEYPYDRPVVNEDQCDLIGITYEDLVFPIVQGACFKILRTWKIIDWCLYETYGGLLLGYNYWERVQVLKVINQFGPEFTTDQPTITECNNFDCGGLFLELIQQAEDDCTPGEQLQWSYGVDLNNDGTINLGPFIGLGDVIDASDIYPLGHHRIIYSFEDRCGNRTVREQLINLNSCKAPVPVCIHGLSTDLMAVDTDGDGQEDTGMITLWASDFNASSYHPCNSPFVLSLAPDTTVKSITFDCDDVGGQVPVFLYATDNLGNQAYCETYVIVADNNDVCPPGGGVLGTITGNISTETADNVLNVAVEINGSSLLPINTNGAGMYTFPSMQTGGSYTVEPSKNNDWKNGVSTLDLVDMQKHLLGIKLLSSPYKMIAADANNSKTITAIDLIELRKLILGIYTELPNNSSWRFVDKTYAFPDPYNPWSQIWPETHALNPLTQGINNADFRGVKIGDVNNTVKANATSVTPRGSGEILELVMDDRTIASGSTIEIPVYADHVGSIEGLQFSFDLTAGLEFVDVKAGILDVNLDNFGWINNKIITSSWNKAQGVELSKDQPLFTLLVSTDHSVRLSEAISMVSNPTHPEAYTTESDIMDLGLSFRGTENAYAFELLQNEPNPFNGATQIGYVIPESGSVILTLFDVTGKELFRQTLNGTKGLNKVDVTKDQIGAQGIVYYQVQFKGYTATKKMLIL